MSTLVLFLFAVTITSAAFLIGDPSGRGPREWAIVFGVSYALLIAIGHALREWIEQTQQFLERMRIGGMSIILWVVVVTMLAWLFGGGGAPAVALARLTLLLLLGLQLLYAYDVKGRSRGMIACILMALLPCAMGGTPAVLATTATLASLGLYLVLHHHEAMAGAYRIRGTPTPLMQLLWCAVFGGASAGGALGLFALFGLPPGMPVPRTQALPRPPTGDAWVWDLLQVMGVLAALAMACAWGIAFLQRGKQAGKKKLEKEMVARPRRAAPVPEPWEAPPPEAGPRRRIILLYIRLLAALGRRPPHETPREFAGGLGRDGLDEATELFYRARYTSQPMGEEDVARYEAAERRVRG